MVLIVTRFVDPNLLDDRTLWLEKAFELLVAIVAGGNRIADYRMRELHRLDEMLAEYATSQERPPPDQLSQQQPTQFNTNICQNSPGVPGNSSNANPILHPPMESIPVSAMKVVGLVMTSQPSKSLQSRNLWTLKAQIGFRSTFSTTTYLWKWLTLLYSKRGKTSGTVTG